MRVRFVYRITGIVQGVGFRPFLYRLATERHLAGFVLNDDRGVLLEVEGRMEDLEGLGEAIRRDAPPLSRIESIRTTRLPAAGHEGFEIRESPRAKRRRVPVSPDAATCSGCLRDILDPDDRRHRYPFTNCTHCGPRLTIVRDVPYDRRLTTMAGFPMCDACRAEYEDPSDRRFHAQPTACPVCGPRAWIEDGNGIRMPAVDPIGETRRLLASGHIVAIKGLGGFHLACDARNEMAVAALRERKGREEKPFALMAADLAEVERHVHVSEREREMLASPASPIVLLERKGEGDDLAGGVAPRQPTLGFMLPYTPLHHLLFRPGPLDPPGPAALVMTSGNRSEEPICFREEDARERLQAIADYFLMHDRPIHLRCDDSIARVFRGAPQLLRRARGYAPAAVPLFPPLPRSVLAVGAMLKNTFALGREEEAILSSHIGDLENLETLRSLEEGVDHFRRLFDVDPDTVAHDLHPDYLSTRYAHEFPARRRIGVQHHVAHVAAVLGEHRVSSPAVGIAFDGTGFGEDGTSWGGEFFLFRDGSFERAGSLTPLPLPGGDAAILQPWRTAQALLRRLDAEADPHEALGPLAALVPSGSIDLVARMLERGVHCPWSSGAGRYFDAIGALLLRRTRNSFEGQVPMELEALAWRAADRGAKVTSGAMGTRDAARWNGAGAGQSGTSDDPPFMIVEREENGRAHPGEPAWPSRFRVDLGGGLRAILAMERRGEDEAVLAFLFHDLLARASAEAAARLAEETGTKTVALGGGVFQNRLLLGLLLDRLAARGLAALLPLRVPANDGGISYGQLVAAAWELRAHG
ncbi:MAG: carbamoyltransferase HypF [Candidatus Eisenbacteria bacterium]